MSTALIIFGAFTGLAATLSGIGKLTRQPKVIATLTGVGVPENRIPLLAALEILGALGLIIGIWVQPLGAAAAIGLALYFLCAVAAHVLIKEPIKESLPAIFLFLMAAVTAALQLSR